MTCTALPAAAPLTLDLDLDGDAPAALVLQSLLARRRSIRRLQAGPFPAATRDRLLEAIRLTPASYNLPPWRVVLIHERRQPLWAEIAAGFHAALEGERLDRYLERLAGFAGGVAVALIFEDRKVERELRERGTDEETARSFVEQALGMVQLTLWLALTAEGLAASLQHWDHLLGPRLARFAGLPADEFRLVAVMPIGYAGEEPKAIERAHASRIVLVDPVAEPLFEG